MAMNKVVAAAIKALSYADFDIKKNYKLERQMHNILHPSLKALYRMEDYEMPVRDHNVPVRLFQPEKLLGREILLFFHGGGWVTGNIDSYAGTCAGLSNGTGRRVISVDYKLAPEFPFPYAVEECYGVAERLLEDHSFLKEPMGDMILIGDSAGGNLSAVVSLMAADRGNFSIGKQVLIYPATYNDHSSTSPFPSVHENGTDYILTSKKLCDYMALYIQKENWDNPYFAPYLAKDLRNQPKTLIITAELDPLRDEGEAYGDRLKEAGNQVVIHRIPDVIHGFFSLPVRFEQVRQVHAYVKDFLEA